MGLRVHQLQIYSISIGGQDTSEHANQKYHISCVFPLA